MNLYIQTPLEENLILQNNIGLYEEYDDIQKYIIEKYGKQYLLPDNANKIFNHMKNKTSFIDDLLLEISINYNSRIHVFQCNEEGVYECYLFENGEKIVNNITYENKDLYFLEYYESSKFGHYGACQIVDDNLFIYDSMMYATNTISNEEDFSLEFINLIRNKTKINIKRIIKDCNYSGYGMEVTGGCLESYNIYVKSEDKEWITDMKYLGVDNQNQFCFMWSIMYIICKITNVNFPNFLNNICEKREIPLVVIKTFIFKILKYMTPKYNYIEKYLDTFFYSNFFIFTSNTIIYDIDKNNKDSIFNDKNKNFYLFKINIFN